MESRPSLEASTPEQALALARAQYGPDAALDVQETRSGGFMGFFATQRFTATLAAARSTDSNPHGSEIEVAGVVAGRADVSSHADTVQRERDIDLEAAISDASQTLGLPMSSPTRPVTSISAGLLHDSTSERNGGSGGNHSGASTEDTTEVPHAPTARVSPFAAALQRVTAEPVVTEAVMNVLDGTEASATGAEAPLSVSVAATSGVALYAVPMPAGSEAGAISEATHVNYAAALMSRNRNPLFPQAPAPAPVPAGVPAAPDAKAPVVSAPVVSAPAAQTPVIAAEPARADLLAPAESPVDAPVVEVPVVVATVATAMAAAIPHASDPTGLLPRLDAAGFPVNRIPDLFLHEVGEKGIHTALTRLIKMRTAPAPALPVAPCTVVVVGPGTEALTAAMDACGALRADASQVAWIGPAHLSNLVPSSRRISTPEGAVEWLATPKRATVVNVIAVETPVSENIDPHTRAVIAALDPTMVLAVVDATRKSEAITRWIEALDCVDAVALENASDTHDPATWLTLPAAPVALIEGRKATAARWASLLCERLTDLADVED